MRNVLRFVVAFILGDILIIAVLLGFLFGVGPFFMMVSAFLETLFDCYIGIESLCFSLTLFYFNYENSFDSSMIEDYHKWFIVMLVIPGLMFAFYWGAKAVINEGWRFWKW